MIKKLYKILGYDGGEKVSMSEDGSRIFLRKVAPIYKSTRFHNPQNNHRQRRSSFVRQQNSICSGRFAVEISLRPSGNYMNHLL
jgi:hypothetical protein